jgi:hypothetical protein
MTRCYRSVGYWEEWDSETEGWLSHELREKEPSGQGTMGTVGFMAEEVGHPVQWLLSSLKAQAWTENKSGGGQHTGLRGWSFETVVEKAAAE